MNQHVQRRQRTTVALALRAGDKADAESMADLIWRAEHRRRAHEHTLTIQRRSRARTRDRLAWSRSL